MPWHATPRTITMHRSSRPYIREYWLSFDARYLMSTAVVVTAVVSFQRGHQVNKLQLIGKFPLNYLLASSFEQECEAPGNGAHHHAVRALVLDGLGLLSGGTWTTADPSLYAHFDLDFCVFAAVRRRHLSFEGAILLAPSRSWCNQFSLKVCISHQI